MKSSSMTTIKFKNPKMKAAFEDQDEWVGLYNKKRTYNGVDKIHLRIDDAPAKGGLYLAITIGGDIADLLEWKAGDKILLHRSNIRRNLLKLTKVDPSNTNAYTLGANKKATNRFYLKARINDDNYNIGESVEAEYDISESKFLVVDLSEVMK